MRFHVTVQDLGRRQVPALDDEFARRQGQASLEELRAAVRQGLEREGERRAESAVREGLLDTLIARHPFDAPEVMVERRCDALLAGLNMPREEVLGKPSSQLGNVFRTPDGRVLTHDELPSTRATRGERFDGELQVPGSHRLVQELIESDLVDQLNLMVFPVILGTGKKALEETPERRNLRLAESKVVGDGIAVLIYERAA